MDKKQWHNKAISYIPFIVRIVWYITLVAFSTIYVIERWDTIVEFTFFTSFNGNNVLFIMWIILLLLPLFNNFEGFGIKFGLWQQKQAEKEAPEEMLKEVLAKANKKEYNEKLEEIIAENNIKINQIEKKRGRK